jgi:8-oxo-dGTP diphosphatase
VIRELWEELAVSVTKPCLAPLTFASHDYQHFHILMPLFICRRWRGGPVPREGQQFRWVRANRLREFPMLPCRRTPDQPFS